MKFRSVPVKFETKVVHGSQGYDPATGAVSFPIYQSATFRHPSIHETAGWDYSRQSNPTRTELEETIADLEGGLRGFAFTTGMAGTAAILDLFAVGDHIIYSEDLYGGTYRYADLLARNHGLDYSLVDTRSVELVRTALKPTTKALFVETPSNPMMRVADIRALAGLCRERGLLLIVDNTFLTPYYQRPLDLGADLVIHSGTKYLAGHNDVLAGFVVAKDAALADRLFVIQKSVGAVLSPFDAWLVLRGLKTLALRMKKHTENALALARWLSTRPEVEAVYYIGLEDHPAYALSCQQTSGFGGMISFAVKSHDLVDRVLRRVKVIIFAESLGGVETLMTYPRQQTHAAMPEELRQRLGVTDCLLRLSVGIEDFEDLRQDLEQAFAGL